MNKKFLLCGVFAAALMLGSTGVFAADKPAAPADGKVVTIGVDGGFKQKHKEIMRKHQEDFENKLKLTDAQKERAKQLREEGRKEIEPLMNQMKELRGKMDELRKKNMEEFEKILTPDQKAELENMKADMEKKMKDGKHKRGKFGPHGDKHHGDDMLPPPPPHGDAPKPAEEK